jgi:hypothetical protein
MGEDREKPPGGEEEGGTGLEKHRDNLSRTHRAQSSLRGERTAQRKE